MKIFTLTLTLLITIAFVGSAIATGPGKTVDFAGGAMGKVVFDGKAHADKGNKCNDCHPKLFQMKKGAVKITAPHKPGEFCASCHDGKKATNKCTDCHKKAAGGY